MDLLISFDDTGSMNSVRKVVRNKIQQLVDQLRSTIDDLRIGLIVHNDYCNSDVIQMLDFTSDKKEIDKFINITTSMGGGANGGECYELVLNYIHSKFNWSSDKKVAILIGDEHPHKVGFTSSNFYHPYGAKSVIHDWKEEAKECAKNNIPVYTVRAVTCGDNSEYFYAGVASLTNAVKLDLKQFEHIVTYINAIACKETSEEALTNYEASDPSYSSNLALKNMFNKLKGIQVNLSDIEIKKLDMMGKFQVCQIDSKTRIKDYVEAMGVHYMAGRGFYQLVKSETVQPKKEILMINKSTGEVLNDRITCRKLLGLSETKEQNINPKYISSCNDYDVFIQSTSYTRNLDPHTKFLYELNSNV